MRLALFAASALLAVTPVAGSAAPETPATDAAATATTAVSSIDAHGAPAPAADAPPLGFMVTATSMIDSRNYDAAVRILETGISEIEHTASRFDPSLPAPLSLLGDAYLGEGEFAKAKEAYGRALHIRRVSEGLHTPSQVEYVYKEARALAAEGDYDHATARQEYAYDLLRNTYGPTNIELVPGMFALAEWYENEPLPNVYAARDLYMQAYDIQARAYGPESTKLVPTLQRLAQTYRQERFPAQLIDTSNDTKLVTPQFDPYMRPIMQNPEPMLNNYGEGTRDLQRAIVLLRKDPETEKIDIALAELDLADWYLLLEQWDRATVMYADVRRIMKDEAGLSDAEMARYFGVPDATTCVGCVLWLPLPPPPAVSPKLKQSVATGHVELSFTVTDRGDVDDLVTVSSEPEGKMDTKVRRSFHSARFRPRFDGGVAVVTKGVKYVYQFSYLREAEPPQPTQPAPTQTTQGS